MTLSLPERLFVPERVLRPLAWPHQLEQEYALALLGYARRFTRGVREVIIPRLATFLASSDKRLATRRADDLADSFDGLIESVRRRFFVRVRDAERTVRRYLKLIEAFHRRRFLEEYGRVIAINPLIGKERWLREAMKLAEQEHVNLITSIPRDGLERVRRMVHDAVINGTRAEVLAAELVKTFGIAENRAMLIAVDQTGTWFGQLQKLRQQDAGIERYRWSTVNDARVRPEHQAREGRVFSWDNPPRDGHPGYPIRCRCVAVPLIDDDPRDMDLDDE